MKKNFKPVLTLAMGLLMTSQLVACDALLNPALLNNLAGDSTEDEAASAEEETESAGEDAEQPDEVSTEEEASSEENEGEEPSSTDVDFDVFLTGIPHPDQVADFSVSDIAKAKLLWTERYESVASDPWKVLYMYVEGWMLAYKNKDLAKELLSVVSKGGEVPRLGLDQAARAEKGERIFRSYWKGTSREKDYKEILEPENFAKRELDSRLNQMESEMVWPELDPADAPKAHGELDDPKAGDEFYFYIKSTGADFPRKVFFALNSSGQWKADGDKNSTLYLDVAPPINLDF